MYQIPVNMSVSTPDYKDIIIPDPSVVQKDETESLTKSTTTNVTESITESITENNTNTVRKHTLGPILETDKKSDSELSALPVPHIVSASNVDVTRSRSTSSDTPNTKFSDRFEEENCGIPYCPRCGLVSRMKTMFRAGANSPSPSMTISQIHSAETTTDSATDSAVDSTNKINSPTTSPTISASPSLSRRRSIRNSQMIEQHRKMIEGEATSKVKCIEDEMMIYAIKSKSPIITPRYLSRHGSTDAQMIEKLTSDRASTSAENINNLSRFRSSSFSTIEPKCSLNVPEEQPVCISKLHKKRYEELVASSNVQ